MTKSEVQEAIAALEVASRDKVNDAEKQMIRATYSKLRDKFICGNPTCSSLTCQGCGPADD
jgi:hypothetical protein